MEVLDTSIANVSLPHIADDLGASTGQGTWVLTSLSCLQCNLPAGGRLGLQRHRPQEVLSALQLFRGGE
jgi:hypothetical protein